MYWQGCLFVTLCLFSIATLQAQEGAGSPRWELGVGVAGQDLPHYRGSDQRHTQVLPIPLGFYTGRVIKVNRDGARGELLKGARFELNLSADVALNADNEDNRARQGMPELDSAFELGPSLNILLSGNSFSEGWSLRLPVRAVATVGGDGARSRGYVFNPRVTWRKPDVWQGWGVSSSVGALWGSQTYHRYYYSVADVYETATRPRYQAQAGFAGYYSKLSIRRRTGTWIAGLSLRYDNLSGATFADSPLVNTQHYIALSFGVGKVFWVF